MVKEKICIFIDQLIQIKSQINELGCYAYKSFIESIWRERERERTHSIIDSWHGE